MLTRSSVLMLALFAPAALSAQRDTTALDTIPVRPLVISVSKVPLQAERIGFAFSVLSPAELEATRPIYASDALRNFGGAYIDEAVGGGGPTIVRLRAGEEVFTQILMDGVQVNQNGGFFDMQGLTLGQVERVEIARGPQSAIWGSSAMTGVINFVTRAGQPGTTRWSLQAERGGASTRSNSYLGSAAVSGGSSRLRYSGQLGTSYTRGFHLLPHDVHSREGAMRIDASASPRLEFTAIARAIGVDANLPVRDPGATRAPLDPNARNERDRYVGLIRARHTLHPNLAQQVRVSTYREDFVYQDEEDGIDAGQFEFFIFDATFSLNAALRRTTGEYLLSWQPPSGRARAAAGAQWERERLEERTGGAIGTGSQVLKRDSRAAFGEVQLTPTAGLDLLLSSRVEKYDGIEAEHTPRASLAFAAISGHLRLRAAAARGFKAPNLQQQYVNNLFIDSNPDLAAEASTSYETGIDVTAVAGKVQLSATGFRQNFKNLIRTVAQENSTKQINRNIGSSHATGLEWELRVQPYRAIGMFASGTLIETRIDDNQGLDPAQYPEEGELPFRPAYTLAVGGAWQAHRKLSVGLRARTVGEQFVLTERFSGQRVKLPSYTVLAGNVEYDYRQNTSVYLRIDNLLDKNYATAFDQRGMPMTFALGIRVGN